MVFDHLNQPPIAAGDTNGEWYTLMKEAAEHKNFYAKISGLATASGNPSAWMAKDLKPFIEFAVNNFGEDRCFLGGDWPVCLLAGNYTSIWEAYKNIISSILDTLGQEKLFYKNAQQFYHLIQ